VSAPLDYVTILIGKGPPGTKRITAEKGPNIDPHGRKCFSISEAGASNVDELAALLGRIELSQELYPCSEKQRAGLQRPVAKCRAADRAAA